MDKSEQKSVIAALKKINATTGCEFGCVIDGTNCNIRETNKGIEIITLSHKHVTTFLNGLMTGINFAKSKGALNPCKTVRKKRTVKKTVSSIKKPSTRKRAVKKTAKRKTTKSKKK